jgi:SAM-dependent methyltransferase
MGDHGGASEYVLGTEARKRLDLLEQCLDPLTTRSLDLIGPKPGWRCLELGGGGGSVTRMLCERVAPTGRVTALDIDTRFLGEIDDENLDVECRDIVAQGLPGAGYDLIHARYLLMHLPTREKILEQCAAALRPGGWLLVEDGDIFPVAALTEGPYADIWRVLVDAFHAAGADPHFGRRIPALFDRAGLEAVDVLSELPMFRGGAPYAHVFTNSVAQMRPAILAAGGTDAQLDEACRIVQDPTQWLTLFATFSVRGRVPANG